jgi:hypothetical protein
MSTLPSRRSLSLPGGEDKVDKVGVSLRSVQDLETGVTLPTAERLRGLIRALLQIVWQMIAELELNSRPHPQTVTLPADRLT